jgi:hypothetical protein
MIITKNIEIIINPANMQHFKNLGYENLKRGSKLTIPVEHLNNGSHSVVKVKCDVCGAEKDLTYRFYLKNIKKYNTYTCSSKCGQEKVKKTCFEKYGDENYNNLEKNKETCLKRYGVENPSQHKEFQIKRKETMIERYGVDYYVLSEDFLEKSENTSMKNYGTFHPMSSDKMKTIKKEYYINNGFIVETDEFQLYKNKVYNLTKKVKNELLNSWDGYDYYDNEYIKDNFNLNGGHREYPTIDHKYPISEGFKNNIPAEELANINNLCFTKRSINSKKYNRLDFENLF